MDRVRTYEKMAERYGGLLVDESGRLLTESLGKRVLDAFNSLRTGDIESGIACLEISELQFLDAVDTPISGQSSAPKHALLWLLLIRALIYIDLARLRDAETLLERVRSLIVGQERYCDGLRNHCFCDELIVADLRLSKVYALRGDFNQAIQTLLMIKRDVPPNMHSWAISYDKEIAFLLEEYGESLGYANLSSRLDYSILSVGNIESRSLAIWTPPFPIDGPVFSEFQSDYFELTSGSLKTDGSEIHQLTRSRQLIDLLEAWHTAAPYSMNVRSDRLFTLFSVVELQIKLDMIDECFNTLEQIESEIQYFFDSTPEKRDFHREVEKFIYRFALTLMRHKYQDFTTSKRMTRLAGKYLSRALDMFDDSRQESHVTQASGLVTSMISSVLEVSFELMSREDLALEQHHRRFSILDQILRRDPKNDRAIRLNAKRHDLDEVIDDDTALEISTWNWSVVPIL
jgi:hypothetical protein